MTSDGLDEVGGVDLVAATVFRDVILIALAAFVALTVLLLPWLNPQGEQQETTLSPHGRVIVELFWPNESESDVDLWVQAPADEPVGYTNKGGVFFNLLRDDLGQIRDVTPINYETAYSRGISPGEQIVNLQLYRHVRDEGPIPVTVSVSVVPAGERRREPLFSKRTLLEYEGHEVTVARFTLDGEAKLVGEIHALPLSLVDPGKKMRYGRYRKDRIRRQ